MFYLSDCSEIWPTKGGGAPLLDWRGNWNVYRRKLSERLEGWCHPLRVSVCVGGSLVRFPWYACCMLKWARYWTQNCSWYAGHRHQCMNVCMNYCKSLWTKASDKCKCVCVSVSAGLVIKSHLYRWYNPIPKKFGCLEKQIQQNRMSYTYVYWTENIAKTIYLLSFYLLSNLLNEFW